MKSIYRPLAGIILFICFVLMTSCSFHMEKRRYRQGYYVHTYTHQTKIKTVESDQRNTIPSIISTHPISEVKYNMNQDDLKDSIHLANTNHIKDRLQVVHKSRPKLHKNITKVTSDSFIRKISFGKNRKYNPESIYEGEKKDNQKRRRNWGWGIGIVSMVTAVVGLLAFAVLSTSWAFHVIFGGILLAIALIIMMICLIVRFAGYKKLPPERNKELPYNKFNWVSFFMGLVTILLAIASLIMFIDPLGGVLIRIILSPIAMATGMVGINFSTHAMGGGANVRNVFGMIMAILGMIAAILCIMIF